MASLYIHDSLHRLSLLLLFYSPSHDGIWWKRGKKNYLQCIAREHKKVVVAASTFDGWDTNLPWRILACSLCIKLMMAIVGIFFFKKIILKNLAITWNSNFHVYIVATTMWSEVIINSRFRKFQWKFVHNFPQLNSLHFTGFERTQKK